jgi:RNA polymerase sigma-70 factor (ECF subfamily)
MVAEDESGSSTSSSLVEGLRTGEPPAWDRLVALYSPLVARWCERAALQAEDRADVSQEVFLAVAAGIHRFHKDGPGDTFRGWLHTVTQNKIRDRFRTREVPGAGGSTAWERIAAIPAPSESKGRVDPDENRIRSRVLLRAIATIRAEFEATSFEAFRQTAIEGRAVLDVAADLGMSPGAVRVAKSRVLRRLRLELGDLGSDPAP